MAGAVDGLKKATGHYQTRAEEILGKPEAEPAVEPAVVHKMAQTAIDLLQAAEKDGTPRLFVFKHEELPDLHGVTWPAVVTFLRDDAMTKAAAPGAKKATVTAPPEDESIPKAIENAVGVRGDVAGILENNGSDPEKWDPIRKHVQGDRPVPSGKSGWEIEIRAEILAIEALGKGAPSALAEMLEPLREALAALEKSKAQPPGPPAAVDFVWSSEVQHAVVALHLGLGDLLGWSKATTKGTRKAAFQKAIHPRRRADKQEPSAAPAENQKPAGSGNPPAAKSATPAQSTPAQSTPAPSTPVVPGAPAPQAPTPPNP